MPPQTPPRKTNATLKLILEMGPLVVFFLANAKFGIFPATAALMASMVIALALSWLLTRHIPIMPLVTAGAVLFFGGLTLFFQDELFIKMKPTIVNSLFGAVLLGGLAMNKPLLPIVLDTVLKLTETGWRILTLRWGLFFFLLALLNEVVWRTQTTDFWITFKVFGTMPITIVFALAQIPLILKYEIKDTQSEDHW
jgi:intracellular septation protein